MKIAIETIPNASQRYPTVGDWFYTADGTLQIKVSKLSDWRREACIAVHELVEVLLCKRVGITVEEVDKFDMDFEAARKKGDVSEPGDDPKAPYFKQHQFAMQVEKMLAAELGIDWEDYSREVESL